MGDEKEVASDSEALNKHRIIQESFNMLSVEINKLDDLICKIKGTNKKVEVDKKEKAIFSLSGFLAVEGNIAIVDMRKRISEINVELRELLF